MDKHNKRFEAVEDARVHYRKTVSHLIKTGLSPWKALVQGIAMTTIGRQNKKDAQKQQGLAMGSDD